MIRMNKLTDYGVVLLTTFARDPGQGISARELSMRTGIPQPTVVKLLKTLLKAGLLVSQRGTKGGYALSQPPEEVPVSAVIEALEGPLADFVEQGCGQFRRGLFDGLARDAFWVNDYTAALRAESKIGQLRVAMECGLATPATVPRSVDDGFRTRHDSASRASAT